MTSAAESAKPSCPKCGATGSGKFCSECGATLGTARCAACGAELIGEVLNVMRSLATELHMTMMVVTHEMGFAREVASRMCFFHEGVILEEGTPTEIFEHTRFPETQKFLDAVL